MYWVLAWLLLLIATILSGLGTIFCAAVGLTEGDIRFGSAAGILVFLTALLGWGAWVCAAMS